MSLIYDALNKAQGDLNPKKPSAQPEDTNAPKEPAEKVTPEPISSNPNPTPPAAYPTPPITHFLDPNKRPEETPAPITEIKDNPNKTKILLGILAILIVIFFTKDFIFKKAAQILPKKEKKELNLNEKINKNAAKNAPVQDKTSNGFKLNGIMVDAVLGNIAIINDAVLKNGDTIGDAQVTSIGEREVELKTGDKTIILKLD